MALYNTHQKKSKVTITALSTNTFHLLRKVKDFISFLFYFLFYFRVGGRVGSDSANAQLTERLEEANVLVVCRWCVGNVSGPTQVSSQCVFP